MSNTPPFAVHFDGLEVGPRSSIVWIRVTNDGTGPLEIHPQGILLRDRGLEYPAAAIDGRDPAAVAIQVGEPRVLELEFQLNRPLRERARLHLRTVRHGGRWIRGIRVDVPVAEPHQAAAGAR